MTRVLWLTKGLGWGGAERLLAAGARHATRERYEIEVAYVLPWKDGLVPEFAAADVPVHCLGTPAPRQAWPLRLRHILAERDYAIVHTHAPVPAVAARLLARAGVRIVHTEHNMWPRYRRLTRWANARTYNRNDAVIAVSKAVAETIEPPRRGATAPPVNVIIHGIEHSGESMTRSAARRRLGLTDDAFVVGTVGNLTAKKDQHTLLDAAGMMAHDQATVVLIGSGPLERDLREHAGTIGLGTRAVFAGSRQDVDEILPAFDVFALSSKHEGLPVSLIEAMDAGVPVVATHVGGIPEVVTDGIEGLLVPPADPAALAAALDGLAGDAGLRERLAAAAQQRARTFDVASAQRRIEDVYDAVLAAR